MVNRKYNPAENHFGTGSSGTQANPGMNTDRKQDETIDFRSDWG
jgi:hypothetical protein